MGTLTAYFNDNDPREAKATYNVSGQQVQIGFPLPEALYRTNHAYDPTIRAHFQDNTSPSGWSVVRYKMMYDGFVYYENAGIKVDELAAVNITAIVGDKGKSSPYSCANFTEIHEKGSNVLSVTFHPSQNRMYVAWEDGTGPTWTPACCNTYVLFDMTQWWSSGKK